MSPTVWEQTSPCCRCQAEFQLSLGLWRVEEDGAEGGEDLPGSGRGQLALGLHHPDAVALPQGQDQAEGGRARAGALPRGRTFAFAGGALQPLDAAVGHGEDGLHALALLRRQQPRKQVPAVQRDGEDACEERRNAAQDSGLINSPNEHVFDLWEETHTCKLRTYQLHKDRPEPRFEP